MKHLSFTIALLFCGLTAAAQNCLTHEIHLEQLQRDPRYKEAQAKLEAETQAYIQNKSTQDTTTIIIPTVFHVIHTGGNDNISNAQILDQMRTLNLEFKRKQADTSLTPAPFKALGGVFRVEFRLATIDPNGNCTNGINRLYSPVSNCAEVGNDIKSLSYWPSDKYLNIWLVSAMRYSIGAQCQGGGYAQFPGGLATTDGVEIRGDLIGSIGTAATNAGWGNFRGRYLIHELGHWFNLRHIWGDATCGNDLVSDTPPAFQSNSGCPSFPHNANNSCGAGPNGEMTSNYMDYSQGACLNIFTKQQVLRMEAAMNAPSSSRNKLWQPGNLAATGTATIVTPNCLAKPEIKPYGTRVLCAGGVASFTDVSYGGTATGRRWSFPGGTSNGQVTDSIINVTYSSPGVYSVSLTRKRGTDSATVAYAQKVVVLADTADAQHVAPVNEPFDEPGMPQWIALNPDGDEGFKQVATTGYTATGSAALLNHLNGPARVDELITPAYDLTTVTGASVKYRLAFAKKSAFSRDKLEVYVSNNCGNTWTRRSIKIANDATNVLNTIGSNVTSAFTPSVGSTTQWREESIALSSSFLVNKFRVKFVFTSSSGNNLYLDDFRITGTPVVGTEQRITSQADVQLWPNPSEGAFYVRFPGYFHRNVNLVVRDVCGRICHQAGLVPDADGEEIPVRLQNLKPGIYFCSFSSGDMLPVLKKVVIE